MARKSEPAKGSSPGSAALPATADAGPDAPTRKVRRLPNLTLLTSTIEGARVGEPEVAASQAAGTIVARRFDELWLDHQPREIVPEESLQHLIGEGRAQPAALLDVLQEAARADPYYQEILDRLAGLAKSISAEGVLQPIQVVLRGERLVVRDGHRRCLASLLAGIPTIPTVQVEEPSELAGVAHALIVNVQREDLTALEKGAALLRLALLVARRLAMEGGDSADTPFTLETLIGDSASADDETVELDGNAGPSVRTTVTGRSRALAAQVRDRVCAMIGLQPRSYYRLLALNRLAPTVRPLARGLTENQLRPIVSLQTDDQVEIIDFARRRNLSSKEIGTLASVARSRDRDAVRRIMARLAREDQSRQRTAVSWDSLLHAVPKDVWRRCQALRAELEALPEPQRRARLDAMWEQDHLLQALRDEFGAIFAAHLYFGPGTPGEDQRRD